MITKPSLSVVPWADSGDRIAPDSAYIASGFPRTNDKPTRQTMNWVLNYATNGVQYLTARGIPDWDGTQNYAAGDVVRSAGKFYSATSLANNINRTPAANPTFWSLWYVFQADLNALFLTPSQANAIYLPRSEVSATFATITNLNSIRDNLQQQINSIQTITGRGYLPGAGIAIDVGVDSSTIRNTSPNVQPDWNATTGGGAILNKPTYAIVATTGNYNDLINRPVLAAVATSGNYNSLTNLPSIPAAQVQSDWNAASGMGRILNRPTITQSGYEITAAGSVNVVGDNLSITGNYLRVIKGGNAFYLEVSVIGSHPVLTSTTGFVTANGVWNFATINTADFQVRATGSGSGYLQIQNNGQFGNGHPWLFSSSGEIQCHVTFYAGALRSGSRIDAAGDIVTATNMGCNTMYGNVQGGNVVANGITCNGGIAASGNISCSTMYGTVQGNVAADYINVNSLDVRGSAAVQGNLTTNARLLCGDLEISTTIIRGNISVEGGYRCRAGLSGGWVGNWFNFNYSGAVSCWIDNTPMGNLQLSSDYRLKGNVQLITHGGLDAILRLRPVYFDYATIPDTLFQSDGIRHAGFIAHEVGEVISSGCVGKKDAVTEEGGIHPQGLNLNAIVAMVVKAVQELSAKVSQLESKMNDIQPELN